MIAPRIIDLVEYETAMLQRDEISNDEAEAIYRRYDRQVDIEFPSIRTGQKYRITPQGWVGYIPVSPRLALRLNPKVSVGNVFRMLEYAAGLRGFRLMDDLMGAGTLPELYSRLAVVLATRIDARWRQGLHRSYVHYEDALPALRGRLMVAQHVRRPWEVSLPCSFEEHTADIDDNRILTWTLHSLLRSAALLDFARPAVNHAYQHLRSATSVLPYRAEACRGRQYDRLNQDYELLHALCFFFLEYSGPSHAAGEQAMLPFLINMSELFETFVAEWLAIHLPRNLTVRAQHRIVIGDASGLDLNIDLLIKDVATDRTLCVLDTKYKSGAVSQPDVYQAVTYATAAHCTNAFPVYPGALNQRFDERVGDIRVRSLTFDIAGNLDEAGFGLIREFA